MLPAKISEISLLPEIDSKLGEIERIIIRQTEHPIKELSADAQKKYIGGMVEHICKDVGITTRDPVYTIRFFQMVTRYYSDFTLQDLKLAFELSLVGKLDKFLPTNKGEVDRNHYSRFTPEYFTKILSSYRKYKNSLSLKVADLTPLPAPKESHKENVDNGYIKELEEAFIKYKEDKTRPRFYRPELVLKTFKDLSITRTVPAPKFDNDESLESFMKDDDLFIQKKKQSLLSKGKKVGDFLTSYSNKNFYTNKIVQVFEFLISQDKTIEDYIIKPEDNE